MNRFVFLFCLGCFLAFPVNTSAQSVSDFDLDGVVFSQSTITEANKVSYVTFTFDAPTNAYNGIIVGGKSTIESPEGWIKWDNAGENEWLPLTFLKGKQDSPFYAGYRTDQFIEGVGFTLRFKGASLDEISISEAGVFDNRKDDDALALQENEVELPHIHAHAHLQTIIPPTLISRSEWNADPFIRGNPIPLANPNYTRMTFHHAACCSASSYEEGVAQVKAIQDFHQDVRGWSDIGYHFLMDQEGRVYQGRPFLDNRRNLATPPVLSQGAHVGGANTGNIGVSVLGCYHPNEGESCVDEMSPAMKDSLVAMFAYLNENYRVETGNLFGHRDQGQTACPGDNNYALLPQLRIDIDTLVARGNVPLALAQGALSTIVKDDGVVLIEGGLSAIRDVERFRIERELNGNLTTVYSSDDVSAPFFLIDNDVPSDGVAVYKLVATSSLGQNQGLAESSVLLFISKTSHALSQSYPNPVTGGGEAAIRYYVERSGIVSIKLYDLNGVEVQTVVEGFRDEDQWYGARVSSENLASGVYYYRMTVTSFPGIIFDDTRSLHVIR